MVKHGDIVKTKIMTINGIEFFVGRIEIDQWFRTFIVGSDGGVSRFSSGIHPVIQINNHEDIKQYAVELLKYG